MSLSEIGACRVLSRCTDSSHLSIAVVLLTAAWSQRAGLSGPSHTSSHLEGTKPAARLTEVSRTDAVSSSKPLSTRDTASSVLLTSAMSLCAASASMKTKRSTGRVDEVEALMGLSTEEPLVSVCHSDSSGCSCWLISSLSQPPAATDAVAIVLSCMVMRFELACCTTRSMLGGSPKRAGKSTSGSSLISLVNSACVLVLGATILVLGSGRADQDAC
mmetsp:Transcript_11183/g.27440  ORF Transcript_11183/g.27440 Transcript_11183/m.27440 type:complete len:217 (-) Transcript_11183:1-651(-)